MYIQLFGKFLGMFWSLRVTPQRLTVAHSGCAVNRLVKRGDLA